MNAVVPADPQLPANPDTAQLALDAFTPKMRLFLMALARTPTAVTREALARLEKEEGVRLHENTVGKWKRNLPLFRAACEAIKRRPDVAASFLLACSQPLAVGAAMQGLGEEGARVRTDSARVLLVEARERAQGAGTKRLLDLIERANST